MFAGEGTIEALRQLFLSMPALVHSAFSVASFSRQKAKAPVFLNVDW